MSPRARTLAIGFTISCAALTVALILACVWTSGTLSLRLGETSGVTFVLAVIGMALIDVVEMSR